MRSGSGVLVFVHEECLSGYVYGLLYLLVYESLRIASGYEDVIECAELLCECVWV